MNDEIIIFYSNEFSKFFSILNSDTMSSDHLAPVETTETGTQRTKWSMIMYNYDVNMDYGRYFRNPNFDIKRAVWGYETCPRTHTRHLQCYIEFGRSKRFNIIKQIIPGARWRVPSCSSSRINYQYCIKSGDYSVIGDWSTESTALKTRYAKSKSTSSMIQALMNPRTALQVFFENKVCLGFLILRVMTQPD